MCRQLLPRFASAGISVDLIDMRTLDLPGIDYDTIGESLGRTGALVIAEEAAASQSIGSALAASVSERCFESLDAPVTRVTSLDIPLPVSRVLERETMISDEKIFHVASAVARRTRP